MAPGDKRRARFSQLWKTKKTPKKETQSPPAASSGQSSTGSRHLSSSVSSISSSHLRRPGSARTPAASAPSSPSATGDQLPSPSVSSVSSGHLRRAKTPVKFDYFLPPVEYYHRPELPEPFDKFAGCVSEENPHRCVVM